MKETIANVRKQIIIEIERQMEVHEVKPSSSKQIVEQTVKTAQNREKEKEELSIVVAPAFNGNINGVTYFSQFKAATYVNLYYKQAKRNHFHFFPIL